ncbi:MAG TPA: pectin acetylesterase-family hydrolase [Candidatus Margulisiibacteriota bacterium]|nr:pectin acetylesterase-family hydrolase [Candidatus Margulisiibacteriota bacterium]
MSKLTWSSARGLPAVIATVLLLQGRVQAGVYATNTCVSQKLAAAATACQQVFGAWAKWEKDPSKDPGNSTRDAGIATAGGKLASAWTKAEQGASKKSAECADTTVTSDAVQTAITSAVSGIADSVNTGVDFTDKKNLACRARMLTFAKTACQQLLKAESAFVKGLAQDPGGAQRDAALSKALATFTNAWTKYAPVCSVATAPDAVSSAISALDKSMVADTTISPNVADMWTKITPPAQVQYNGKTLAPMCTDGSQYVYFVKRGTVNKLLVYYEGGGACWDYVTCKLPAETPTTGDSHNPALSPQGFFDLSNPANPFADWNMVFVPYCTGDVHWGNAKVTYEKSDGTDSITIQHRGWVNAQVVEKWTREHFVNPDVLLVAGSSAGGYGALFNSLYLMQNAYQASQAYVVDDAGNGVITPQFQTTNVTQWGVQSTLPKWIPALRTLQLTDPSASLSLLVSAAANFYPRTPFAQYTTAYDNVQTTFYNLMVKGDASAEAFMWWLSTCDWHDKMTMLAVQAATAASNLHYYIGAGSRHTIWGNNRVYTDTAGGVPVLTDWINAMLTGSGAWSNVECADCSLESGDPRPSPLVAPFGASGAVTCP